VTAVLLSTLLLSTPLIIFTSILSAPLLLTPIIQAAEDWLKKEDLMAFHLRESIIKKYGSPASAIRPEGKCFTVM
jgi:hypothetical protein